MTTKTMTTTTPKIKYGWKNLSFHADSQLLQSLAERTPEGSTNGTALKTLLKRSLAVLEAELKSLDFKFTLDEISTIFDAVKDRNVELSGKAISQAVLDSISEEDWLTEKLHYLSFAQAWALLDLCERLQYSNAGFDARTLRRFGLTVKPSNTEERVS